MAALVTHGAIVTATNAHSILNLPLNTKITFTPTNSVLISSGGLSAGPAVTTNIVNGAFSVNLDGGPYTVSLPLIPTRDPFGITVPNDTNTYDIVFLATNLQTWVATNWSSAPSAKVLPGTNIFIGTNNPNTPNETITVSAIPFPFGLTNVLFVTTNGNDSTAVRGRMDRPFLTLTNASAKAVAGDTVAVLPGTYNITNNLARDQVNWYFYAGSTVIYTNPAAFRAGAFSDFAGPTSFTLDGQGVFKAYGTINPSFFVFSNANTVVNLNGDSVYAFFSGGGDVMAAITDIGANVSAKFRYIYGQYWGVIWTNGPFFVAADTIEGDAGAVAASANGTNGDFIVKAGLIKSLHSAASVAIVDNGIPGSATWIDAGIVKSAGQSILNSGGKLYVNSQKLFGGIECDADLLYVDSDKIENPSGQTGQTLFEGAGGISRIRIAHWNDTGGSQAILITGGTNWIFGGDSTMPVTTTAPGGAVLNMIGFISSGNLSSTEDGDSNPDNTIINLHGCAFSSFNAQDGVNARSYFSTFTTVNPTLLGNWTDVVALHLLDGALTVGSSGYLTWVGPASLSDDMGQFLGSDGSGNLTLNSAGENLTILNLRSPVNGNDPATKNYVDGGFVGIGTAARVTSISATASINGATGVFTNSIFAPTNKANWNSVAQSITMGTIWSNTYTGRGGFLGTFLVTNSPNTISRLVTSNLTTGFVDTNQYFYASAGTNTYTYFTPDISPSNQMVYIDASVTGAKIFFSNGRFVK